MKFDYFGCQNMRYLHLMTKLTDFVRRRARQLELTQEVLAQQARMSRQGLVKLLSGDVESPRIGTIRRLAVALNVNPIYLFQLLFERSLVEQPLQSSAHARGDHSFFVADITIPNGMIVPPGYRFEKIWEIQNGGVVNWQNRELRRISGADEAHRHTAAMQLVPDADSLPVPDCRPGDVVRLAMWFTAPTTPCTCVSEWKLHSAEGGMLFPELQPLNCVVTVSST